MITNLPEVRTDEESGVQYNQVLHAFLDERWKNVNTGEAGGEAFGQHMIPIALLEGTCTHTSTVCSECLHSWKQDYDIMEDTLT